MAEREGAGGSDMPECQGSRRSRQRPGAPEFLTGARKLQAREECLACDQQRQRRHCHDDGGREECRTAITEGILLVQHQQRTGQQGAEEAAETAGSGHGSHGQALVLQGAAAAGEGIQTRIGQAVPGGHEPHIQNEDQPRGGERQPHHRNHHQHQTGQGEPALIVVFGDAPDDAALDDHSHDPDESKAVADLHFIELERRVVFQEKHEGRRHGGEGSDDEKIGEENGGQGRAAVGERHGKNRRRRAGGAALFGRKGFGQAAGHEEDIEHTQTCGKKEGRRSSPKWERMPPITGPIINPRPNAAPIMPITPARFSGAVMSER